MFGLINLIPLPIRLAIGAAVFAAVVGGFFAWRAHQRQIGWDNALKKVEQRNEEARKAAKEVQRTVDECFDQNGWYWDIVTGKCEKETMEPTK